jgi:hypothetical protein
VIGNNLAPFLGEGDTATCSPLPDRGEGRSNAPFLPGLGGSNAPRLPGGFLSFLAMEIQIKVYERFLPLSVQELLAYKNCGMDKVRLTKRNCP